ncbi:mitochondrial intermembrane space import and assembly protein 40-like [Paramacrobiotus metropolitanus]|uniref:mitochondrial intermembrane space import and assembly protein 40-like n=1 Tax=Paramacrobiotus metropolitanus TaxID=2943436 RepID=UPI0024461A66|nr:mitochondrial intermembrane space import and assembly protein 40-like [Paramacrobiotus metropolitanus]
MGTSTSSPVADTPPTASQAVTTEDHDHHVTSQETSPLREVREIQSSYCKEYGKDKVIFLSRGDWEKPPDSISNDFLKRVLDDDGPRGVVLPNGEINWGCPCLGNLTYGPCALPFRQAFSCFHFSTAEAKGSDCIEQFRAMTECMAKYPNLYPMGGDDEDEDEEDAFATIDKAEKQAESEKRSKRSVPNKAA